MPAFTPGNLVIYRVGTGTGTLAATGTAVFLDEYTPAGLLVQSIAMPTADAGANQALTANGTSTAEGMLDLSSDGRYLILTGYDAAIGAATSSATSAVAPRVIGRVDSSGNIDTTTTLTNAFSVANIRGATSLDGTTFWATGSNTGVVYTTLGASTGTAISGTAVINLRAIDIFDNQLFISTSSGSSFRIGAVGTGTPTTTGQPITNIPGGPTTGSPYQFVFVDLSASVAGVDTLYIADDTAGQIQKYTFNGSTWAADGAVTATAVRGLTASVSGTNVSLYGTSATTLFSFSDATGYDGTISGAATSLAAAGTNTAFRGIDFAPQSATPPAETQTVVFNPTSVTLAEGNSGATLYTFTVTRTGGTTGILDFSGSIAAGTTDGSDFVGGVVATSFSGSIAAGQSSATVTVSVVGDNVIEANEAFSLTLTNVSNQSGIASSIGANATATGNITNDDTPVLTIDNVTLSEGDSGTVTYTFTVSLDRAAPSGGVTFDIATADGTATEGSDYAGRILTSQSIAAGQTSYTFDVTVNSDDAIEPTETFYVNVTNVVNATVNDGQGDGTITSDDAVGSLSIADVGLAEGNSGTRAFTFTVTRSGGDDGAVSATWTVAAPGGSGVADTSDLAADQPLTGSVSFADGETSKTITVNVAGDSTFEPDETFTVTLSDPQGGVALDDASATGTIQNDDAAPAGSFAINDVTLAEGDSGTTAFTFTVTRTGGSAGTVGISYEILAPGGAGLADGSDFAADQVFTGTLSFGDGETSKTITANVLGDTLFEANEGFGVHLSNATGGASIDRNSALGSITNDDAAPPAGNVSIADARLVEGNSGTSTLLLTVTRTDGTAAFSVEYATSNGGNPNNASATAGTDYAAASGTVSFGEGETSKTISITINGDTSVELNEEFTVTLSGATGGATIQDSTAMATIENDDTPTGTVSLLSESFDSFRGSGFSPDPTAGQLDSDVYIASGFDDATNPSVSYGGTVTSGDLARGTVSAPVPTSGGIYALDQGGGDHAFLVQPTGNDFTPGDFTARIANTSGLSADTFEVAYDLLVRNDQGRSNSFNLSYSTDGTTFVALSAFDYTSTAAADANGVVTVARSGQFTTAAPVAAGAYLYLRYTSDDVGGSGSRDEFGLDNIAVSAVGGAAAPLVTVSDASVNEAAGTITFTVTRSNLVGGAFSVDYATANGTATAGSDYTAASGTLSFADNQVRATVTVAIADESTAELDETFLLNLGNATGGAIIADSQAVGTIVNDDGTPIQVSINDVSVAEGDSGTKLLTFTVTRTGGTGAFSIDYSTANGTAIAPGDFAAASGTLNFAQGQTSQTVSITINGDTATESTETFQVLLSGGTNGVIVVDGAGTGTITNDEPLLIHDIQGSSYYSPILAAEGKSGFNVASTATVLVRAVVTAVDNEGDRQGFYITEETGEWDSDPLTSEGIFVMTRNDAGIGTTVSGVAVGDIVTVTAKVIEYQAFQSLPRTMLVDASFVVNSTGNPLPVRLIDAGTPIPNSIMTLVTPDFTSATGATFDATRYALSFWETVEGMLVTIPDMVVASGRIDTSGGRPYFQAYSRTHADADQINSRGGYTVAGDPPSSPPDTTDADDDTIAGGRHLHDGDTNPDIIEVDFTGFAMTPATDLVTKLSMGDGLGDVTGIVDFDFTDRKLFVTGWNSAGFVNTQPTRETTSLGNDARALTVATFNVENLDAAEASTATGAARFQALAGVIANNLNSPDIVIVEEIQDNNGAAGGTTDASLTWQKLVDALNALVPGAKYQWVDQEPVDGAEGGEPGGNIRVGFLYDTNRVQLGDLPADASIADRRKYTDRIGDGVTDAGDLIQYTDEAIAADINAASWASTRLPLLGQFTFGGNTVFVIGNHFSAKGGSGDFWQLNQTLETGNPENSAWAKRNEQALDVYTMMNHIQANSPNAGIVSGGDYNDFYFYRPLEVVTGYVLPDGTPRTGGARFDNLTLTLTEAERYTYTFDGRSQALDHMVANSVLSQNATYDVVHVNTGFSARGTGADADQSLSDHDPAVASFGFHSSSEVLAGTGSRDVFRMEQGGDDRVSGHDGNDTFYFGAAFTSADFVDGGAHTDSIILDGNYAGGLVLGTGTTSNIVGIETISLTPASFTDFDGNAAGSNDYDIETLDSNVAQGAILKVNGFWLGAGEDFSFDGTLEKDGKFILLGGQGVDDLTGGEGNDIFAFGHDGRFAAGDEVEGGLGYDSVYLRGDYEINFNDPGFADSFESIESVTLGGFDDIQFTAGGDGEFHYAIVWNDALLDGGTITFNSSGLSVNETMTFDGSREATANFRLWGGAGVDDLEGGGGNDLIYGGGSADKLTGGAGTDTFRYHSTADSTVGGADSIEDFASGDVIDLSLIDANVHASGNQAFTFVTDGVFTNQAGQLRAVGSGGLYTVEGDTDGNGEADLRIVLHVADAHPITAVDFVL